MAKTNLILKKRIEQKDKAYEYSDRKSAVFQQVQNHLKANNLYWRPSIKNKQNEQDSESLETTKTITKNNSMR